MAHPLASFASNSLVVGNTSESRTSAWLVFDAKLADCCGAVEVERPDRVAGEAGSDEQLHVVLAEAAVVNRLPFDESSDSRVSPYHLRATRA